jgi:hypothetical protein
VDPDPNPADGQDQVGCPKGPDPAVLVLARPNCAAMGWDTQEFTVVSRDVRRKLNPSVEHVF